MISVENLSIAFGSGPDKLLAVDDISFHLLKGQSLGLVGESGSGKSVTALAIMRLLPPQAILETGKILFNGKDLLRSDSKLVAGLRGNRIAMIFQEPMTALNPVKRCGAQVAETIARHRKSGSKAIRQQVIELFRKVKLPRPEAIFKTYPHQISGGQKQRVMIAMAIANKPDLLIADEPTTALDVTVQKEILDLLNDLKAEYGMSLLFISHDLGVVARVADEVAVMYKGKIVEQGKVKQIFSHPEHPYTKGLMACRPPLGVRLKRLPTIDEFLEGNGKYTQKEQLVNTSERKQHQQEIFLREPILSVDNLLTKYPLKKNLLGKPTQYLHAVDHVSFQVFPGETLGLVGESGCGKTTLGRSILRLIEPDCGTIFFDQKDLLALGQKSMKKERQHLNIVFQDPYSSLNPRMSVGQALMEPLQVFGLHRNNRKAKVLELLEKVGLKAEHFYRYPHEFSGGQRQRIVIARALTLQPKFIICDEAVSALDVSVQARVLNLLNELKEEFGFTYIFISHDLAVVRFMSDRIMVMKDGKIIESGDADEIYLHPQNEYTRQLLAANIAYSVDGRF
ncbi:MAG: ABC transporter ATP-binding protein [Bacteroidales bacterium]|nr:ABC transporter ATP-binding protein [Bacteroidales bacterium]MCF6341345.1 ABC transporter ATP-binding protein [Bacteroidales bacterium]